MIDSVNMNCAFGRLVLTRIVYRQGRGSGLVGVRTNRIRIVVNSGGGGGFLVDCVLEAGAGVGPNFFKHSTFCRR